MEEDLSWRPLTIPENQEVEEAEEVGEEETVEDVAREFIFLMKNKIKIEHHQDFRYGLQGKFKRRYEKDPIFFYNFVFTIFVAVNNVVCLCY